MAALEKSFGSFSYSQTYIYHMIKQFTLSYLSKRNEVICAHTELFMNIPLTFIWWNPNWEQHKCPPTDECTSEIFNNGMLFVKISKLLRHNRDQSQNKYSKWKKSDTKVQTLYDIQCNETLEKKKMSHVFTESISLTPWIQWWGEINWGEDWGNNLLEWWQCSLFLF